MTRALPAAALLLAALLSFTSGAHALDFGKQAIGTTGSDFLTMDIGARGIAMGGAFSALTNDSNSLYWNPAGLSKIPRLSASFMYNRHVQDIFTQSANAAWRVRDMGVIAGGWRYRDIGPIDYTGVSGQSLGTFRPRDYVVEAGWGQAIYDLSDSELDVHMGVAARWVHSQIIDDADSFAGDIGIQSRYYTGSRAVDLSFVAQNMGVGSKFEGRRDAMPFRMRLGAAYHPIRPLALSIEGIAPINNVPHGAIAGEYDLEVSRSLKASVRAGFNSLTVESLDVFSTFSCGFGLQLADLSFDYAFTPMGVLGAQTHKFSFSFNLPAKVSRRFRER